MGEKGVTFCSREAGEAGSMEAETQEVSSWQCALSKEEMAAR